MRGKAKSVWFAFWLGGLSLLIATSAAAQTHSGIGHPGGVASSRVVPIRPGARVGTPLNPNFAPIRNVPGLSFNIQALAAADRRNARRDRRGEAVTPFLWSAPYYSPYLDYDETPQPPYDYSYGQPPYGQPQNAAPPAQPGGPAPVAAPEAFEPPAPARDVGQFVLVRLDGQSIFASAFMVVNGRITYVTREGIRRSFPISELDKNATREINEANGTSVSLPD